MKGIVVSVELRGGPPLPVEPDASRSQSLWQSVLDADDYLVLLGFDTEQDVEEDLKQFSRRPTPPPHRHSRPPDVHHVTVSRTHGAVLDQVPVGGLVAVTKQLANMGFGPEAAWEVKELVSTLAHRRGYCGHIQGSNEVIDEEAWAFVFAGEDSNVALPMGAEANVRQYRRVG